LVVSVLGSQRFKNKKFYESYQSSHLYFSFFVEPFVSGTLLLLERMARLKKSFAAVFIGEHGLFSDFAAQSSSTNGGQNRPLFYF